MNKQTKYWLSTGKGWTDRNAPNVNIKARARTFKDLISNLPIKTILEVGCNKGYNLTALSTIGNYELMGIDILDYAIDNTECNRNIITLLTANAFNLPFVDSSFDLVLTSCFFCIFPYKDIQKLSNEISRVSSRYILIIEYSILTITRDDLELSVTLRGSPLFWARNYQNIFEGYYCISNQKEFLTDEEARLRGFNDPLIAYWLFEKKNEIRT